MERVYLTPLYYSWEGELHDLLSSAVLGDVKLLERVNVCRPRFARPRCPRRSVPPPTLDVMLALFAEGIAIEAYRSREKGAP